MNRLVVLNDQLAVFASDGHLSMADVQRLREQFKAELPGWRVIIIDGPAEVLDIRGDEEATALARELYEKVTA